jgi:hypothetical protein
MPPKRKFLKDNEDKKQPRLPNFVLNKRVAQVMSNKRDNPWFLARTGLYFDIIPDEILRKIYLFVKYLEDIDVYEDRLMRWIKRVRRASKDASMINKDKLKEKRQYNIFHHNDHPYYDGDLAECPCRRCAKGAAGFPDTFKIPSYEWVFEHQCMHWCDRDPDIKAKVLRMRLWQEHISFVDDQTAFDGICAFNRRPEPPIPPY